MSPSILAMNEDFVVVDKPTGVATEPDRSGRSSLRDAVATWLAVTRPDALAPHALSRLDVPVSGAVTFAISRRGHALAPRIKERGGLVRRYIALCAGALDDHGLWDTPVDGKRALSRFASLARATHPRGVVSLGLLEPVTGRTHQLRIHTSCAKSPILGDGRYGGPAALAANGGRVVRIERLMLHAAAVRIDGDPRLEARAPVPESMRAAWRDLGGLEAAWEALDRALLESDLASRS
jgi:23S rRNA-/tRNA-specific pseudouridylate synthase